MAISIISAGIKGKSKAGQGGTPSLPSSDYSLILKILQVKDHT